MGPSWLRHQSDVTGRITSGNCGPLSGSEVKNGRATSIGFRRIWSGGTASSKSNDRTKENSIAFILTFPRVSVGEYATNALIATGSSLGYSEAVANARVRAGYERQQITKDARNGFNGLGDRFPTFWSEGAVKLNPCARLCANPLT